MKIVGWLMAGGAVLFLAEKMGYLGQVGVNQGTTNPIGGTQAVVNTGGSGATNATTSIQGNQSTTTVHSTLNDLIALMKQYNQDPTVNRYSAWVYGTYYALLRGIPAPDPFTIFPNRPNLVNETLSVQDWWSAVSSSGFSGMGAIAQHVNPYTDGPRFDRSKAFGAGLTPSGMEMYEFVKGRG